VSVGSGVGLGGSGVSVGGSGVWVGAAATGASAAGSDDEFEQAVSMMMSSRMAAMAKVFLIEAFTKVSPFKIYIVRSSRLIRPTVN
jgi:hypothetical protein